MSPREKIALILQDLQRSAYFRIYFCSWCLCAFIGFIGFFVIRAESSIVASAVDQSAGKPYRRFFKEPYQMLRYPPFTFTTDKLDGTPSGATLDQVNCTQGDHVLPKSIDLKRTSVNFTDEAPERLLFDSHVECSVTLKQEAKTRPFLRWTVQENLDPEGYLQMAEDRGQVVEAGRAAYILFTYSKVNDLYSQNPSNGWVDIQHRVVYQEGLEDENAFKIVIKLDSMEVDTYDITNNDLAENGFELSEMTLAGVTGGLWFFLYVLHSGVMSVVGFFVQNDSDFLKGGWETPQQATTFNPAHGAVPAAYTGL